MVAMDPVSEADVREARSAVVLDAGHVSVRPWRLGLSVDRMALALQERCMNAKSWKQLEKLAARCTDALRNPRRQSEHIFRGCRRL